MAKSPDDDLRPANDKKFIGHTDNKKVAETIKIDPMEFKIMKEAQEESGGDYKKYKDLFYKKYYKYKRRKNIKLIK